MNKKTIIYIACAVAVALIIALAVYFAVTANKTGTTENKQKIVITKYDNNFEVEKSIEVTKKKQVKELIQICDNVSLEQDETSKYLAIKNDIKVDLANGVLFYIQLELTDYCYIENSNSNIKAVIKMPQGLYEYVQNALQENNA